MDGNRFDEITRGLANRRGVLKGLISVAAGLVGIKARDADAVCSPGGWYCQRNTDCCSAKCYYPSATSRSRVCCTPTQTNAQLCAGKQCGIYTNSCGQSISCGTCPTGDDGNPCTGPPICSTTAPTAGQCVTPNLPNGTDCGDCMVCNAGQCGAKCTITDQRCCGEDKCGFDTGHTCAADSECCSGFCTDGVCCKTRCDGRCEFCKLEANLGSCTAYSNGVGADPPPEGQICCNGTPCYGDCDSSGACICTPENGTCDHDEDCCDPITCLNGKCCGGATEKVDIIAKLPGAENLVGIEMGLYAPDCSGSPLFQGATGANGTISFNAVPLGSYCVQAVDTSVRACQLLAPSVITVSCGVVFGGWIVLFKYCCLANSDICTPGSSSIQAGQFCCPDLANDSIGSCCVTATETCCKGACCLGSCDRGDPLTQDDDICCPTGDLFCEFGQHGDQCCPADTATVEYKCCGTAGCCAGQCYEEGDDDDACCEKVTGFLCAGGCCPNANNCCGGTTCCAPGRCNADGVCCSGLTTQQCGANCCNPNTQKCCGGQCVDLGSQGDGDCGECDVCNAGACVDDPTKNGNTCAGGTCCNGTCQATACAPVCEPACDPGSGNPECYGCVATAGGNVCQAFANGTTCSTGVCFGGWCESPANICEGVTLCVGSPECKECVGSECRLKNTCGSCGTGGTCATSGFCPGPEDAGYPGAANGDTCTVGTECCSTFCCSGTCSATGCPSCEPNCSCAGGANQGLNCNGSTAAVCHNGSCVFSSDICGNQVCGGNESCEICDTSVTPNVCKLINQCGPCGTGGVCVGAFCPGITATTALNGSACASNGECCSGLCCNGLCQAADVTCVPICTPTLTCADYYILDQCGNNLSNGCTDSLSCIDCGTGLSCSTGGFCVALNGGGCLVDSDCASVMCIASICVACLPHGNTTCSALRPCCGGSGCIGTTCVPG